jgi:putative flippase GtrA
MTPQEHRPDRETLDLRTRIKALVSPRVLRWLAAGVAFMGLNMLLLYLLVDKAGMRVIFGTLISAECGTLLRYLVNDYWVFHHRSPSWKGLAQYHVANAGAFTVWWGATNLFNYFGVHYLLASILAVGFSVGVSLTSNFFWIWRKRDKPAAAL